VPRAWWCRMVAVNDTAKVMSGRTIAGPGSLPPGRRGPGRRWPAALTGAGEHKAGTSARHRARS
jgi:hypothetical protein